MKCLFVQFLFSHALLFAQVSIKGIVMGSGNQPLPLSNIVVVNKFSGTITDEKGAFVLENITDEDSVKISNVAYQSRIVSVKRLLQKDTILLAANEVAMNEVVVGDVSGYQLEQMFGYANYPDNDSFSLLPGNQLALYVANENEIDGYIKGISSKLKQTGKCKNSMRLRLLNLDTFTSLPSGDLLRNNILLPSESLKKSNYVDLSKYKIMFPAEGIIVLVEWVYPDTKCDRNAYAILAANLTEQTNLIWLNFRDGVWKKSNRPRLSNGNFMIPNIGVKIGY